MKRILVFLMAMTFLFASMPVMAKVPGLEGQKAEDKVQFTDISKHWAKDTIVKMADKGLIKGVGNGKFLPDDKMKRSEFVSALHKTLEIQINYFKAPDINEFFKDVKNDDWFAAQLYDLATLNIIDDRGKFRPDDQITREEMVHYIIYGYNYKLGTVLEELENSTGFSDDSKIDKKYKKAVNKAVKLGFIRGKGKNIFDPKGITTRAEALVVLERLITELDNIKDAIQNGEKESVTIEPGYEKSDKAFKMKLKITNNTKKNITISHTSGQKFDFKLLDDNKEILYTWSMDKMFIMALSETVIEPGKSIEFSDELDMESFNEIISKAKYMKAFIVGTSNDMAINNEGYEIMIESEKESVTVEPGYEKSDKAFKMKLKITNNTETSITISHTSGQKFDFKLLDDKKEVLYTWSMDKAFAMILSETVIEPGKSIEFSDELDMESFGEIVNKTKYMKAFIVGISKDMAINNEGYETEIESGIESVLVEPSYEKTSESFKMKLKITNNTKKNITISHTSGQKFDFKLLDEKKEILYTWSMDKSFIMMLMDTVIKSGESIEFGDELDMKSFGKIVNEAKYLQGFITGISDDMTINSEGYEIEIK